MLTEKQKAQRKWAWRRFHLAAMKRKLTNICEELGMNYKLQGVMLLLDGLSTTNDFDAISKGVKVKR